MLRKSFAFILLILMTCAVTFAQETPEPEKSKEKKARDAYARVYSLFGGGSYLGVQTREVTKENFSKYGLSRVQGVAIEKVMKDSPAEKAGLQDGDVITRFNGESVTSTRKLTRLISEVAVDHTAELTVLRNGSEQNINVTMGKRSSSRVFSGNFEFPNVEIPRVEMPKIEIPEGIYDLEKMPKGTGQNRLFWNFSSSRIIGVSVSSLTKQLGDYFGVEEGKGLLVNNIVKDSPAERAGLKAGDVIIEVDGQEVKNSFDLVRKINEKKDGDVNLTIIRDKNRQMISVTPEKRKGNSINLRQLKRIESDLNKVRMRVRPKGMVYAVPSRIL